MVSKPYQLIPAMRTVCPFGIEDLAALRVPVAGALSEKNGRSESEHKPTGNIAHKTIIFCYAVYYFAIVNLSSWVRGGADGALEGPTSDAADLFLHGAGERDELGGYIDEVVFDEIAAGEFGAGDGRDDALFDFGTAPTVGEL